MSTSSGAFGLPARKRRHSRQARSFGFAGTAAVAALVLGCGWTVHTNILGASIYPSVNSSVTDAPVAERAMSSIVRKTPAAVITAVFGDLPQATAAIAKGEAAAVPAIMFNERFASADGVAPAPVEGVRLASATPSVEVSLVEPAKKQSA